MHTNHALLRSLRHGFVSRAIAAGLLMSGGVSHAAGPVWKPLGDPVRASASTFAEVVASRHSLSPILTAARSHLYLAWTELNLFGVPQLYVRHWNGNSWILDGGSQNRIKERRAYEPTLASDGPSVYLAWIELSLQNVPRLQLMRLTDGHWSAEAEILNLDADRPAANPALSANASAVFLAWTEQSPERVFHLHSRRLTPDGWRPAGDAPLNVSTARDAMRPPISQSGDTAYAAWMEMSDQFLYQIHVKQWTGTDWQPMGGSLNMQAARHAMSPSIAVQGQTPYVAWTEIDDAGTSRLYLKHWTGTEWAADGESQNLDPSRHALSPAIWRDDAGLFLAWTEYDDRGLSRVHIKRKTNRGWEEMENRPVNSGAASAAPVLAGAGKSMYAAWKEMDSNGLFQIAVRRLEIK
ncbi:MAG TPA: hypothetical protein VI702_02620 [Nitrospiria bacterium]